VGGGAAPPTPTALGGIMKVCTKCNELKEDNAFTKRKDRPLGLQSQCKDCAALVKKLDRAEKAEYIRRLRETTACIECGKHYNHSMMVYQHRNSYDKLFNVSEGTNRNWVKVLAEIDKCDIICANCHKYRHYLERVSD